MNQESTPKGASGSVLSRSYIRGPPGRHEKDTWLPSEFSGRYGSCAEGPRGSSNGGCDDGSRVCERELANVTERERVFDNVCDVNRAAERGDVGCCFSLECTGDSCEGTAAGGIMG